MSTTTNDDGGAAPSSGLPQHDAFLLDDLELRPPLPTVGSGRSPCDESVLLPLLCRMFVASKVLKLSTEARFASLVLLHRYHDASSQEKSETTDWKWIAAACLFLGSKTEEEIRRMRDIINLAHMLEFGAHHTEDDSSEIIHIQSDPTPLDDSYWSDKEKLVATEQAVLRMLQFDVTVSHPHRAVCVLLSKEDEFHSRQQRLLPICWQYLNQSLFHAPALRHDALSLSCASVVCACLTDDNSDELTDKEAMQRQETQWWHKYGVLDDTLQSTINDLRQSFQNSL